MTDESKDSNINMPPMTETSNKDDYTLLSPKGTRLQPKSTTPRKRMSTPYFSKSPKGKNSLRSKIAAYEGKIKKISEDDTYVLNQSKNENNSQNNQQSSLLDLEL